MALSISDISVSFQQKQVLKNFTLPMIDKTETVVLIGKNGAGKSTLLKQMTSFIRNQPHKIQLDGQPLAIEDIGYLPQEHRIQANISVLELLVTTQHVQMTSLYTKQCSLDKAMNLLADMGLTALANKTCTELSGGESQMVGLAQAVINDPKVLILDEPTAALDLHNQLRLLSYVKQYTAKLQVCTLMVLHDLNLALQYADKIAVLKDCGLYTYGAAKTVINQAMIQQVFNVDSKVIEVNDAPFVIPQYQTAAS